MCPDCWLGADATPGEQPMLLYRLQDIKNLSQLVLLSSAIQGEEPARSSPLTLTAEVFLRQHKLYPLQHSSIWSSCLQHKLGKLWLGLPQVALHTTVHSIPFCNTPIGSCHCFLLCLRLNLGPRCSHTLPTCRNYLLMLASWTLQDFHLLWTVLPTQSF